MFRSFKKNGKEGKNVAFFWKEWMPNPADLWTKINKNNRTFSKYFETFA